MRIIYILVSIVLMFSCKEKREPQPNKFDKTKWLAKDGNDYPYRDLMLGDFISNFHITGIKSDSVLKLLGRPNRVDNGHFFYTVYQKYFPNTSWPMSTKTLVIKLGKDGKVEWRKIHG